MMSDAYILAGARTPIGNFLGAFRSTSAPELGAVVVKEALQRTGLGTDDVDEVIMGNVVSAGVGQAPARQVALKAGLPASVAALTVNKVCGSGLKAVMLASQAIRAGDAKVVVAGGMENMSMAPHILRKSRQGWKLGDVTAEDALIKDGLWCAMEGCHMGMHAEHTADIYEISRENLDQFSVESHQKASKAVSSGAFNDEIVAVTVKERKKEMVVEADEGPRPDSTLETLAKLRPAFSKSGIVTAGNASTLSDGAAAVVVTDEETAGRAKAPWKARIVASHTFGIEPQELFIAPVEATRGVLKKAGMELGDIDLFEMNEAFASQMIACQKLLEVDTDKVNVHGGAIALGHPIGASGTRILVTLLSALKQRNLKYGLASICLGGGNAVAVIVERC